jgi:hypothetical protein
VRTALLELGHTGFQNCDSSGEPATVGHSDVPPDSADLMFPEPHPADYDWRFTANASRALSEDIRASGKPNRIALLGAPTLFHELCILGWDVTLFDRNPRTIEKLRQRWPVAALEQADLFSPPPQNIQPFDLVFADPPWYVDFYQAFILRGAQMLRDGGTLMLSVLPWLTRPEAVRDRAAVLSFAIEAGFDLRDCRSGAIGYESPRFEQEALATHGIKCHDWRFGDLYWFRKAADPPPTLALHPRSQVDYEWDTFEVGTQQIKLKHGLGLERGTFTCRPVAKAGSVFDSVSRRAPSRSRIDLWTSGNLAYTVTGAAVLRSVLLELQGGSTVADALEQCACEFTLTLNETATLQKLLRELVTSENGSTSRASAREDK